MFAFVGLDSRALFTLHINQSWVSNPIFSADCSLILEVIKSDLFVLCAQYISTLVAIIAMKSPGNLFSDFGTLKIISSNHVIFISFCLNVLALIYFYFGFRLVLVLQLKLFFSVS